MDDSYFNNEDRFEQPRFKQDRGDDLEPYEDDEPPPDAALFALPKTRLSVTSTEFRRSNRDGTFLTRIPLNEIEEVEFRRPFCPLCLLFLAAGAGIAAIGYAFADANWLRVTLYVVGFLTGLLAALTTRDDYVVFQHRGEERTFDCLEPSEEVSEFAASLRDLVRRY